jgi:RNA polymerase sigma factor (sigma-70 family)
MKTRDGSGTDLTGALRRLTDRPNRTCRQPGTKDVTTVREPVPGEAAESSAIPSEPAGFADWVGPHLAAMARLATRLAPTADRDDIVQESLVRAWVKRQQFDPDRGALSSWLLAITADQARKARARSRPRAELVDDRRVAGNDPPVPGPDPVSADSLDLARALGRLSGRQRLVVDCFYYVGLTVTETAAVMGCAEGTVKSTLSDARARLRDLLEERT